MIEFKEVPCSFLDVKKPEKKDFIKLNEELVKLFKNDILKKSNFISYDINDYSEYSDIFITLLKEFYFKELSNVSSKDLNELKILLKKVLTNEKENNLEFFLIALMNSSIKLLQLIYEKNYNRTDQ